MDRYDIDQHRTGPREAEPQATDARLSEIFRRNAPPANETHLAAALRPAAACAGTRATVRKPKRTRAQQRRHTAAMAAGALAIAAAIGVGTWQAAANLGDDRVMVITNQTTTSTAASGNVAEQLADGVWELRPDRQADLEDVQFPSDEIPESAYKPIEDVTVLTVVISDEGRKVAVGGHAGEDESPAGGVRTNASSERVSYDLVDLFAGGRLVIWQGDAGLEAEYTVYGSGVPIALSYRGTIGRATEAGGSFEDVWAASVAAVNALGPTRVTITQTVTLVPLWADDRMTVVEEPEPSSQRWKNSSIHPMAAPA